MITPVRCYLCNSDDYSVLYNSTTQNIDVDVPHYACTNVNLGKHGRIVKCRRCGLIYNNPRLAAEKLKSSYEQVDDPVYIEEIEGREATFRDSLSRLEKYKPSGKMLDVGCYTGMFLHQARQNGWDVCGLEPSRWACKYAREQMKLENIHEGTISEADFPAECFDVITMWDVIEHLAEPVPDLKRVAGWLKKDGLLCLTTHDMGSVSARILRSRYPFLMEMHVVHFTRETLKKLLDETGFQLMEVAPHVRTVTVRYLLSRLKSYNRTLFHAANAACTLLSIKHTVLKIGFMGLITAYARK